MNGFFDDSDPNAPQQEYEQYPSGEKEVAGISDYIFVDDQGVPYWKERDGRQYILFHLRHTDGTQGPPMSAGPGDLPQVVAAFAGHVAVDQLPADRASTAFLLKALELANGQPGGKPPLRQVAYVGKRGFVKNMSGMYLPTDRFFRFVVDDIRNLDGKKDPLYFQEHKSFHQEVINVRMRVVGDVHNNRTIYDGGTVTFLLENPFSGAKEVTLEDGTTAMLPAFKKNSNDSTPRSVQRIKAFVNIYAPEVGTTYEWVTDPARSAYGTNEAENPIVVIADHALRGGRIGIGKVTLSTKSERNTARLDLLDFVPADTGVVPGSAPVPTSAAPVAHARPQLLALYDYIRDSLEGAFIDDKSDMPPFSEDGKQWARTVLLPHWDRLGLPPSHMMADLSEDQATALLGELLAQPGAWPKKREEKPQTTGF